MFAPITIARDRDRRGVARRFFFRQKRTASHERNAKDREIIGGNYCAKHAPRVAFLTEADEVEIESHNVAEDRVLLANIEIGWIRKPAELFRILFVLRKELHHFVRLGISRRSKEKCVHDTKHGGV